MDDEPLHDVWGERPARTLLDRHHRLLITTQHLVEGRVPRDLRDPQRQRDVLTGGTLEQAVPVPAVGQQAERRREGSGYPETLREHLRHLAEGGEVRLGRADGLRQPPRHLVGAPRTGHVRWRQSPQDPAHPCGWRGEVDRSDVLGQAAAEQLLLDVQIGGAPGIGQQRHVVGLGRRGAVNLQQLGEPHRHQRGPQPVLERKTHRQIGRETGRTDDLRSADVVLTGGRRLRHVDLPAATLGDSTRDPRPPSSSNVRVRQTLRDRPARTATRTADGPRFPPEPHAKRQQGTTSRLSTSEQTATQVQLLFTEVLEDQDLLDAKGHIHDRIDVPATAGETSTGSNLGAALRLSRGP